jgi:hypothetical protein
MKIILSATIEGISTRVDNTIAIKLGTQELDPAMCGQLFQLRNKLVKVLLSDSNITKLEEDLVDAENIAQVKKGKSPSQRFRSVLFLVNKSQGGTDEMFEQFYATELEKLIEHYKKKLD